MEKKLKLIISRFLTLKKQLALDLSEVDAAALAAQLAVTQVNLAENSEDRPEWLKLKMQHPYKYRYEMLKIIKLDTRLIRNTNVSELILGLEVQDGPRILKISLAGESALRFLTLLKIKFANYREEVSDGVSGQILSEEQTKLAVFLGLHQSFASQDVIHLKIKQKFSVTHIEEPIINLNGRGHVGAYRLEFSPSKVVFANDPLIARFNKYTNGSHAHFCKEFGFEYKDVA